MAMVPSAVFAAIWSAVDALIPSRDDTHPLGCHNPRVNDRDVLLALVHRVAIGCSYDDAGRVVGVHGRTLRRRRDEWLDAGVFEALWVQTLAAYDRLVGLCLDDLSVDACITKAPCGGESAGRSPVDRGKQGCKRSVIVDGRGVPLSWTVDAANQVDRTLLAATFADLDTNLTAADIELPEWASVHADRGYDYQPTRETIHGHGFDPRIAERGTGQRMRSRQRWVVERTNAWHNHFGQLRRCTDRQARCVDLSVLLASVIICIRRLIARAYRHTIT